jgi:excisionase family DNA binding protein
MTTMKTTNADRTADPLPRLLSLSDAAAVLGCSLKTLRRRIDEGELPVIRDGRLVRIHPEDLTRYVAVRRSQ